MQRHLRYSLSTLPLVVVGLLLLLAGGCARNHYQVAADHDTYRVLHEKNGHRPWYLPPDYSIDVDPQSRLFDPSNPNDPQLPHPGPDLYVYQLPQGLAPQGSSPQIPERLPTPLPEDPERLVPPPPVIANSNVADPSLADVRLASAAVARLPEILPAVHVDLEDAVANDPPPPPYADAEEELTIQPIPEADWAALPQECLSRMLEFASVREEYQRTFGTAPPDSLRDQSPKLTFDDIVQSAYLNSREYQRQKEILYSAALALTLERYDYLTKFSVNGNGVDVFYDHRRTNAVTSNTLRVPSSAQADRMLALGGTFVTRFANDVLLTFNPGYAEVIGSDLIFEFTQSVFQRDILLEPLIQSERNVVYAGRTFARFRKQFYFGLAQTYYQDLLSTYRGIEIDTRNYFAFVRALDQAEAEVRSGVGNAQPRVQIDQIEQNMLVGRSRLITTCNNLETSLDQLKLTLGLPTELPINIDLQELDTLTQRDEIEVAGELVRRARERVDTELQGEVPDREEILSAAVVLLERTLEWLQLREQSGQAGIDEGELRRLRASLRVGEGYEALDRAQQQLAIMQQSVPPTAPINVFRGTMYVVQSRLDLIARQLQLADQVGDSGDLRSAVLERYINFKDRSDAIRARVARVLRGDDDDLNALQDEGETLLREMELLEEAARKMVQLSATRAARQLELQQTMQETRQLLATTDRLAAATNGLAPIDLTVDDAMVTALVQRFELMNERGALADDWRTIKLAADDLKSALNLNVRQSFLARNNKPFNFSFENSRTEVGASLDLPLNRREQRNTYKRSLINYNVGRRSLMELEDNIKFAARQDLRQLKLDRVQYNISVVSAALASERVYSTQLELALGLGSITARDFNEAQQAYAASLSAVANGRLGYIVNRAQLALDLELMMLDNAGFWPELTNDQYQPKFDPIYPFDADPTYGELPHGIWPTKKIKRMLHSGRPGYQVIGVAEETLGEAEAEPPAELPPPAAP